MKTITNILLILILIIFKTNSQEIKSITETVFGETEIAAETERQAKRKLRKLKTYPEHFDLYFVSKSTIQFDSEGNLITQTDFGESGEAKQIRKFEFTDFGDIKIDFFINPLNQKSNRLVTYKYNENNDLIQINDSSFNYKKQTDISYTSDSTKLSILKINGKIVDKWVTQTDSEEKFELTTAYDNNDSVFSLTKRWYNENEKLIKQVNLDKNQQPTLTRIYKYGSDGNKIFERVESHYDSRIIERNWIVDSVNNTKDFKTFTNGKLDHFSRSYYDKSGNETKTEFFDSENTDTISFTTSSEYEYDTHNNWVEKKDFWDKEIHSITYRQINYYE
ncbi:hypothetical protein [Carboxylicivirga marina]|uniref:hypothetical protein n=1 Tax=Carboxylicivirga marina TaxID=2800988 RepID=UPI0025981E0E|nr:hypothetical protein [uncultured Carboxylicivirga sp.]